MGSRDEWVGWDGWDDRNDRQTARSRRKGPFLLTKKIVMSVRPP